MSESDPVNTIKRLVSNVFYKSGISASIKHVEMQADEIWITNVTDETAFYQLSYETKRLGVQAFDVYGLPYIGGRPVFINREEAARLGMQLDHDKRIEEYERAKEYYIGPLSNYKRRLQDIYPPDRE